MSSSASILIKKGKLKEVDALKKSVSELGDNHVITKFLKNKERPFGILDPVDFRFTVATKYQTLSIMPEYNKKAKTGFINGMHPPEIMGGALRDAGEIAEK
jgi:hypothetical protein